VVFLEWQLYIISIICSLVVVSLCLPRQDSHFTQLSTPSRFQRMFLQQSEEGPLQLQVQVLVQLVHLGLLCLWCSWYCLCLFCRWEEYKDLCADDCFGYCNFILALYFSQVWFSHLTVGRVFILVWQLVQIKSSLNFQLRACEVLQMVSESGIKLISVWKFTFINYVPSVNHKTLS